MRTKKTFYIDNLKDFKNNLLEWSNTYNKVVYLDSNHHKDPYGKYDLLLAVDAVAEFKDSSIDSLTKLNQFQTGIKDWVFGYLAYDIKNDIEDLHSKNEDHLHFPKIYFFQPGKIFLLKGRTLTMLYLDDISSLMDMDFNTIINLPSNKEIGYKEHQQIKVRLKVHKDQYLEQVNRVLDHISRGDIYEMNYCQEFFSENAEINPLLTFKNLNDISESPFAVYLRIDDLYALCSSPERYLKRQSNTIISQPIKGTAKRSDDPKTDLILKKALERDPKEISENVMIVDLVRNDLSKTAIKGTVKIEELCKVYSFKQVHQMISTISSTITDETSIDDLIKTTFPMGSMTGAPKISAMKIIEHLEFSKRGLYSGSIGYIEPNGDFDFNVVIRSILYNANNRYVSYSVGSAITAKSTAIKEYEECLVKAKAMREALEGPF